MSEVTSRLFPALADRYLIKREIGSGGMATVYLARDLKHDRDVDNAVLHQSGPYFRVARVHSEQTDILTTEAV